VHEAVDGGITFFDNCWEYNRGKSENWMGKGLKVRRRYEGDDLKKKVLALISPQ
jgi:predicted aldo/keto reductase-like oxidoreductase